jgi:hypothetical protein
MPSRRRTVDRTSTVLLLAILALGLALRIWLNARSQWMIDGDEALFGIGAVRLLHGDYPNLLYGVPYMGMLQSYLAAPIVAVFGPSLVALRCVTLFSSVAYIVCTWLLGTAWCGRAAGLVAASLAAVPSVYFDAVGLKVWGSYLDVMVMGDLLLFGVWSCRQREAGLRRSQWFLLGLLGGLALWANLLIVYYLLPAVILLPWRRWRRWLPRGLSFGLLGVLLGGAPLWVYNIRTDLATFRWLFAGSGSNGAQTAAVAHVLLVTLLPRLAGLTSPWGPLPTSLVIAMGAIMAAALLSALDASVRPAALQRRTASDRTAGVRPLLLFLAALLVVYMASGFGRPSLSPFDASGRYLLPLWSVFPILLAAFCVRLGALWRPAGAGVLVVLLAGNLAGHLSSDPRQVFQSPYWNRLPPDCRPLLRWLQANDIHDVWMNHWAGDQIMYLSGGSIRSADYYDIVAGRAINRFPAQFQRVRQAPRAAFVVVQGSLPSPGLDAMLRALGVGYREASIGDYRVFLPLSRQVDPFEVANALRYPY